MSFWLYDVKFDVYNTIAYVTSDAFPEGFLPKTLPLTRKDNYNLGILKLNNVAGRNDPIENISRRPMVSQNVFFVNLLSLRIRKEGIPALVHYFFRKKAIEPALWIPLLI